ncbi:hypothetical protein GCM10014719_16750 [Planomonospora parontospora subsp. antibiotica]|nr:hypothetical protein GCM10014719_16750 [Planomonospora parontospora subsp. antibiotica]GII15949.1 hypothetical protein Ppa05_26750 [Planomonospora parontospora subsp. antibiotica]
MQERRPVTLLGGPLDGLTFLSAGTEKAGTACVILFKDQQVLYEPFPDDESGVWLYGGVIG